MVIDNICKYCGARNMEKEIADVCGSNLCTIRGTIDNLMNTDECPIHSWWYTDESSYCPYCNAANYYGKKPCNCSPAESKSKSKSSTRKDSPVFGGVLQYFPDAIMEIAKHSKRGNDKHNPGQPLHWAKDKSSDQADCVARHLIDIGPNWDALDAETGSLHATALAWRALALLQTVLERKKK